MLYFPFVSFFIFILFFGSVFSLCSAHWFGVWIGLEINLIGFIPIMVQETKSEEVESSVKYFLIQSVGSSLLLLGILLTFFSYGSWSLNSFGGYLCSNLMLVSLMLKLGMSPFHFWLPSVVGGLSWLCNIILLTWQKVGPLFSMFFFFSISKEFLLLLIILSSFFGGVGGVNQTSLRGLLAYSSILHLGWVVSCLFLSLEVCFLYFVVYSFLLIMVCLLFIFMEIKNNKQFSSVFLWKKEFRVYFCLSVLSMGGMPPMLGFFMKWFVLMKLSLSSLFFISLFLILGSMVSLYYYLILSFSVILSEEYSWKFGDFKFFFF
uniref:NADH-ubiquinone oxidoreductase chain 2 n=1 Tax=Tonicina zschaui TaxID=2719129 RepID=A0A6H1PFY4_9MOLL|nr:NADH dehydrogenase subunit 2 [Tonicina zschaui]